MTADLHQKIEEVISRNAQADDREIAFQLKRLLNEFELRDYVDKEAINIADLVAENIRHLNDATYQNIVIRSGFHDFDAQFGGFFPGEFTVVGGRPAMGKTQFLVNIALNISANIPVLYVTLDMSEFSLTNRFISSVTEIPAYNFLRRELSEAQKRRLSAIGNEFRKRQLFIHASSVSSIATLKAHCQKQIQGNDIKVIIIDCLQLLSSHRHRQYRELEVSHISRELKNMAKEHHVCVIVSSQLNRSLESRTGLYNKRPQLADLRDSGAIEQDADKVIFIHRPEYYGFAEDMDGNSLKHVAEIIVAKNRNGAIGEIQLLRDTDFTNFGNKKNEEFIFSSKRLLEFEEPSEAPF